jgi:Spy/CpxP family protein refolding chaperone
MQRKLALIAAIVIGLLTIGAEKPRPSAEIRLPQPWNKLIDLTDAQKIKLDEIHRDARAKQKAIEEQAKKDMLAVLTPEQQAQIRQIQDDETADKKTRGTDRPVDATTLPGRSLDE